MRNHDSRMCKNDSWVLNSSILILNGFGNKCKNSKLQNPACYSNWVWQWKLFWILGKICCWFPLKLQLLTQRSIIFPRPVSFVPYSLCHMRTSELKTDISVQTVFTGVLYNKARLLVWKEQSKWIFATYRKGEKKVEAWASAVWQWQLFHSPPKNEYEALDIKPNGDHYLLLTEAVCQQPHKMWRLKKSAIIKFAQD